MYDRRKKRLVEEIIDRKIVLAMRAIYQSKFGLGLMDSGMTFIILISQILSVYISIIFHLKDCTDNIKLIRLFSMVTS